MNFSFNPLNCCRISKLEILPVSSWVRHLTFGSTSLWLNTAGGLLSVCLWERNALEKNYRKSACWAKRMSWPSLTFPNSQVVRTCQSAMRLFTERHVHIMPGDGRSALLWVQLTSCTERCGRCAWLPTQALSHPSLIPLHRQRRADSQCCCSPSQRIKCSPRPNKIGLH